MVESMKYKGKEYILKEEYDKIVSELEKKQDKLQIVSKEMLLDEANVLGVGTVKVNNEWHAVRLSTEYLEKIIKGLKAISFEKGGLQSVEIIWAHEYPCIIGRLGKDNTATGFILAPRVEK